jgi:alpha-tubulin suppressor-like RCC1 family protein
MRTFRAGDSRVGRTLASNRGLLSDCLVVFAVALVLSLATILVCTASVSALAPLTPGSQLRPAFSSGGSHSLAIKSDGSLWAWGANPTGELGNGSLAWAPTPVRIGIDTDWLTVSADNGCSLALKKDGSLWAWGSNFSGALGDGTMTDRHTPTRIGTETDWVVAATGRSHSLGIRSDGSLRAWGMHRIALWGDNGFTSTWWSVPTRVGTAADWLAVAPAEDYDLAVKKDGSLWAWGRNSHGQLGDGTTEFRIEPTRIGSGTDWVAVAACGVSVYDSHSLGLKSDGSLWAWGQNTYGELGDGTKDERLTPTRVGKGNDWVAIAGGYYHSLALKSDGSLWGWGRNHRGQVGDGTTADRLVPTRVGSDADWVAISANAGNSMALKADGSLWAWGANGRSQSELGDGTIVDRLSPIEILRGLNTTLPANTFPDVPVTNCYYAAISAMAGLTIISGYPDGTFGAEKLVLRKHFAKMIVGAMGLTVTEDDWQDSNAAFTDCGPDDPTSLYPHDYIAVAKAHNLTAGKTAATFAPDASITRAQMVTMVVRAAQNSGITLKAVGTDYAGTFRNYSDPNHGGNVHLADCNGLLQGLQIVGAAFSWMGGNATRGEVAQVLWNLTQLRKTDVTADELATEPRSTSPSRQTHPR